jgi:hypothetical protein
MTTATGEPQPSEWVEVVEGESNYDTPMKMQVTDDEIVLEGTGKQ